MVLREALGAVVEQEEHREEEVVLLHAETVEEASLHAVLEEALEIAEAEEQEEHHEEGSVEEAGEDIDADVTLHLLAFKVPSVMVLRFY